MSKKIKQTEVKSKVKTASTKKIEGNDLSQELIDVLVERGRRSGMLSYEEFMEFCDKNHLSEVETNDLLKLLEKENIELVMQEEMEADSVGLEPFEKEG